MKQKAILFILMTFLMIIQGTAQSYRLHRNHFMLPGETDSGIFLNSNHNNSFVNFPSVMNDSDYMNHTFSVRYQTSAWDIMEYENFYYVVGYTMNKTSNPYDSLNTTLLFRNKFKKNGDLVWSCTDSLANGDHFTSFNHNIIKLPNHTFLSIGFLNNNYQSTSNYEYILPIYIKFDTAGTIVWQRLIADTVGRKFGFWPMDAIVNDDSGFTVAGLEGSMTRTFNPNYLIWQHDTAYITIIQYDSLGYELRRKQHFAGGTPRTTGVDGILRLDDGGYAILGNNYFNHPASPFRSFFVMRLDSNLNYMWTKYHGQMISELYVRNSIIPAANGGYWFAVNKADTPSPVYPPGLYTYYYQVGLMNENFDIVKDTIFRIYLNRVPKISQGLHAGIIFRIEQTKDDQIVIGSWYGGQNDFFCIDTNLNILWKNLIWDVRNQYGNEWLFNMRKANDNGYLLTGLSACGGGVKGWLVKTDSVGCMLPGCKDTLIYMDIAKPGSTPDKNTVKIYPNPVNDLLHVIVPANMAGAVITLYDITGRVEQHIHMPDNNNVNTIDINTRHLQPGVYILNLVNKKGEKQVLKVVKN